MAFSGRLLLFSLSSFSFAFQCNRLECLAGLLPGRLAGSCLWVSATFSLLLLLHLLRLKLKNHISINKIQKQKREGEYLWTKSILIQKVNDILLQNSLPFSLEPTNKVIAKADLTSTISMIDADILQISFSYR